MTTLRPQQEHAKQEARRKFCEGFRCVGLTAPTGSGKGVLIGDIGYSTAERGKDVLIVTDRRQIVKQLRTHCEATGVRTGVIMGSEEADHEAQIQIASIQTLERRGYYGIKTPDLMIIDECHKMYDVYRKLMHERFPTVKTLGFTATPVGPNGAKLTHFDVIIEPIKNSEQIAAGHLLRVDPYVAPYAPDLGGINLKSVSQDELGQRVESCVVYGDVFTEWQPYSHMQTMVILPSRAVCNGFLSECLRRGISAKVVDGTTKQDERDDTFNEFKAADCQMLLGVDVIREGLDLPIAQCLIMLAPTSSFRVYWQSLGRIKRPHDGQESGVVLDFAGNLWNPSLFVHPDQDPPWDEITNDTTIEEINEKKAGVRCPECGSKDIYSIEGAGYKCEVCKHEWKPKPPWCCPHCKQALGPHQRCVDGCCPNCGQKVGQKPMKRVRMESGEMRTVPVEEIKQRKKCNADSEEAAWLKWIHIANNCNHKPENADKPPKTLGWVRVMYKQKEGKWPRRGMKYVPDDARSPDWKRAPASVYPWLAKKKGE